MRSEWSRVLRTPLGVAAGTVLLLVLATALLAPVLWGERAELTDTANLLAPPSAEHWAGTDHLGRDIFWRTLVATRLSIVLALGATAIAVGVGLLLGALPALLGRRAGRLVTTAVNIFVAFPGLLLALFFAAVFGAGMTGGVLAIGLAGAPSFARLCQTMVSGLRQREFVAAARISGASKLRVLVAHILPNIAEPLVVNATIGAGSALLSFAGLSFLGLGVQPPDYDFGRLMQEGLNRIYVNPLAALVPGAAVVICGLAFNLTGEAIARTFAIPTISGRLRPQPRTADRTRPEGEPAQTSAAAGGPVLDVADLRVTLPTAAGSIQPVRGVGFTVGRGEAVGIVGESGSGKSLTAMAIAQLVEAPGRVDAARLDILGVDLKTAEPVAKRTLLGTSLALVFQDPMTSFNPVRRMGGQLAEVARAHLGMTRRQAYARAVQRLGDVRIDSPAQRARQYPHEFSGGMRQRAMLGMGVMGTPALIIADEPTTALDVTVQAQVLDLIGAIRREDQVAVLLISHDVAVVSEVCDRVLVMYAGRVVEDLPADQLQEGARHPYTRLLAAAVPDLATDVHAPLAVIPGRPIEPQRIPAGCAFAPRCPLAIARCRAEDPALTADGPGRRIACWRPGEPLGDLATDVADELDDLPVGQGVA